MRRIWQAIVNQFKTLDLLPSYFGGVKKEWWNIAWGESLITVVFILWWSVMPVPAPIVVFFFGSAFLIASYYIWRADHLRLIPRLAFAPEIFVEPNLAAHPSGPILRYYVQVLPKCLMDVPVEQCQGHLLRVQRWNPEEGWKPTQLNESLDLVWSFHDSAPRTLQSGNDKRLNIFWFGTEGMRLEVNPSQLPIKASNVFVAGETYRFDVSVTSKDCPPINISIGLRINKRLLGLPFFIVGII